MRFKKWLEDAASSGAEPGNLIDPNDNGLVRTQWLKKDPPQSEKADKLFLGRKKYSKK